MENTNANDNSISESNVNTTNRDGGWTTSSGQSISDLMSETAGVMDRFASEGHDNTDFYDKDTDSSSSVTAPAQTQVEQVEQAAQPKPMDLSYIDVEIERTSSPTEMQVEAAPVAQPVEDEEEEKSDILKDFHEKYKKRITTDLNATPEEHQAAKDQQTEDDVRANERANEIREPVHFKLRAPVPSSGVRGMLEEEAKDAPKYAQAAESDIFGDDDPFAGFTTGPSKTETAAEPEAEESTADNTESDRVKSAVNEWTEANNRAVEAGNTFVADPSYDTYKEFETAANDFREVDKKYAYDEPVSRSIMVSDIETLANWADKQEGLEDLITKYSSKPEETEDVAEESVANTDAEVLDYDEEMFKKAKHEVTDPASDTNFAINEAKEQIAKWEDRVANGTNKAAAEKKLEEAKADLAKYEAQLASFQKYYDAYKENDKPEEPTERDKLAEELETKAETAMDERLQAQREFEESTGLTSIDDVDTVLNSDEYTDEQKAAAQKLKDALAKEDSSFTSAGTLDGYDEKRDAEIDEEVDSLMTEGKVTEALNKLEEKHTISFETPRYEVPTEDGGTKTVTPSEATEEVAKKWEELRKAKYKQNSDPSLTYENNNIAWSALEEVAKLSATGAAVVDLLNDETTVSNEEMGTTASTFASDVSSFFKDPSVAGFKKALSSLKTLTSKAKQSQAGKIVAVVKGFVADVFTALGAALGGISAAAVSALARWVYNLTKSELNTKDESIDTAIKEALHESSGHDDLDLNLSSDGDETSDAIKFDRVTSDASNASTKEYNWGLKASDVNVKYIYSKSPTIRKFVKNIG